MNDSEIFPVPLFYKMHNNAKKAKRQDNHNRKMNEPCDPSCPAAIQFMAMAGVEEQSSNAIYVQSNNLAMQYVVQSINLAMQYVV